MAGEGSNVGSIFGRLGFHFDSSGSREYEAVRRRLKGDAEKPIEQRLGATVDDTAINVYNRKLEEIRQRNKRREDFQAKLGADYDPRAFNAYERDLRRTQRATQDNVRESAKLHTAFGNIYGRGGALFAAAGGLYGLVTAFKSVTTAYQESQVSQEKLRTQLKASNISYREHATEIDRVIQKTSQLAGLDDEDLQDAFTNIVRVTGDVSKSLRLTGLAADFARAKHMDVAKAGELVGKVAGGNLGILSRYGIVLQKGATATEALGVLQQKFGGQAAAYGRTQAGSLDRVQVAWENLRETIGQKLAPTITKAANALAKFLVQMQDGTGDGGKFVRVLERIWNGLKDGEHFIKDHIGLIKLAAGAWIGYRTAALAAAAASKVAALAAVSSGAGGAAGAGAAAAGGGAAAGALRGRLAGGASRIAGAAGGLGGAIVVAGGFKAITDAIRGASNSDLGLLNQYASALERVSKAGDAGGMRKLAAQLRETAKANADVTKGEHLKAFATALDTTAKSGGSDLRALQAAFKAMGKSTGGDLDKAAKAVQDYGSTAKVELNTKLGRTLDRMDNRWEISRGGAGLSLKGIRKYVVDNMRDVKQHLGEDSEDGKQALAHNFEGAVGEIRQQMRAGSTTTKAGMAAIRGYLTQELRLYGFSISQAKNIAATGDPDANKGREGGAFRQSGGFVKRARGGWIGGKGMVGDDTVPVGPNAIAAPGEFHAAGRGTDAIINRHQAPLANLFMLASGGPFQSLDDLALRGRGVDQVGYLDSVMAPMGGLAGLFSAIQRPHMMQSGGLFRKFAFGGVTGPVASLIRRLDAMGFAHGSTTGGGHAPNSYHYKGEAVDYGNASNNLSRLWSVVSPMRGRFAELFGPQGLFHFGAAFSDPALQAQHNDHIHMALTGAAGALGAPKQIRAPRIRGGGAVGQAVQAALSMAASGANRLVSRATAVSTSAAGESSGTGAAGTSQMRAWAAAGLRAAGVPATAQNISTIVARMQFESSGDPRAVNRTDSNAAAGHPSKGLMQTIDSTFQAYRVRSLPNNVFNPVANVAAAVRYMIARYGHLVGNTGVGYKRGGFIRRLQGGGFTSPFGGPITAGSTFAANSGLANVGGIRIRALGKKISHSVGDYDQIMGDHGAVDSLRNRYSLLERMYNRVDDGDLVDEKTGELNTALWQEKLRDLSGMGIVAQQIEAALRRAQVIAKRTLATYKRLVRQLSQSLAHAGKKDRGGLRQRLKDAKAGVTEWSGSVSDLSFDVPNAHLDYLDLGKEFTGMQGAVSSAQQAFADALAPDTSGDAGSADTGVPSTADIAAAARQQLDSFQSNLQTLYGGFGRNYIPLGGVGMGGQGGFATPGYFGAGMAGDVGGGTLGNSGGGVYVGQITNVYPTPPEDPHTWSRNLAFELGAMG